MGEGVRGWEGEGEKLVGGKGREEKLVGMGVERGDVSGWDGGVWSIKKNN